MKSVLLFSATAMAAVIQRTSQDSSAFTMLAARSASPIHLQSIQASGGQFFIGKDTAVSCPSANGCGIYTTNTTALTCTPTDGTSSRCAMHVVVPGGQEVFVRNNGSLGYTAPHSGSIPDGSFTSGFNLTTGDQGRFSFTGNGSAGLVACPATPSCNQTTGANCAPWSVLAALPGLPIDNCLSFDAIAQTTNVQAWEYD
jgi:hypothetical protein